MIEKSNSQAVKKDFEWGLFWFSEENHWVIFRDSVEISWLLRKLPIKFKNFTTKLF